MKRRSRRLVILTYHRVLGDGELANPDDIDARQFRMHVDVLHRYFNVLRLSDAVRRLRNGGLPGRAVAITFDDGYKDNVSDALPILERRGLPATFFIATGFLNGGIMWNDVVIESVKRFKGATIDLNELDLGLYPAASQDERRAAWQVLLGRLKYRPHAERNALCESIAERLGTLPPTDLMMDSGDLRILHDAGMEIGAHTRNHPILSVVSDSDADDEIVAGKRDLERIIGQEVTSFAYPNGRPGKDYRACHVDMVQNAGFELAVTTAAGCVGPHADVFQLGRLSVWHRSRPKLMLRMLMNFFSGDAETA